MPLLMKGSPLVVSMPCNGMRSTARAVFATNSIAQDNHPPGVMCYGDALCYSGEDAHM
jgi:hypothetical protein